MLSVLTHRIFLIGFILMAIINTIYKIYQLKIMNVVNFLTTICLLMAMVALGLNVSLKDLRHRAFKPLIAIIIHLFVYQYFTFLLVKHYLLNATIPFPLKITISKKIPLDSNWSSRGILY
ncbi:membrane spanning protein [Staphylococcus gallinarum]|uniref:Membrane spanning protein n=1 Tax=Staphylococcus gallinarum TaxID=1293 RepID=A0A380F962_STAGA|nr:membrane spanning protein [Staphylococcus gallinarum]